MTALSYRAYVKETETTEEITVKKLSLTLAIIVVLAVATSGTVRSTGGDAERAEGIARSALSDCISTARAAGNDIGVSSFAGSETGDWNVVFCSSRRDIQHTPQRVGNVVLDNWVVVETRCEFPAPTNNPCF